MTITLSDIKAIVAAGHQAPSGDNCQPLRFVWRAPVLEVHNCPDRDTGLLNYKNYATWTVLGAAIKNMELAANSRGWAVRAEIGHTAGTKLADLHFAEMEAPLNTLAEFI